ncbi:hypothetical protein DXG03_002832 [Asterophora parasitica]|uniref:Uncharacterized protein n=1 Tax=Asterophora parasitica TaxID=117018 RepID=A0A9P7G7Y5_9AGAR|nr:hypothetical protein DXG03_002832 [Asterophora parasitica]
MLASHGSRTVLRHASNYIPHTVPGAVPGPSRGIHIPSFARVRPRILNLGQTQKLFSQSRHIVTQFFNLLTAPTTSTVGHSVRGASTRGYSTIQQRASIHLKSALARSSQTHFLPRAPIGVPRSIAQVGLGTARNFSSTRPIFQNLVENIPITGRALYEADIELNFGKQRGAMRKPSKGKSSTKLGKEMLKPRARDLSVKENKPLSKGSQTDAELEHYFATPAVPDVTTCLLIPLAPTPATRTPLPSNPDSLLPLPTLASIHVSHEIHSLRVSTLFTRLDAANVWERGVQCSTFSHGGGADGVCTMLKVEFVGWTKAEVRSVLGESGTGWCVLEEVKTSEANGMAIFSEDEDDLSDTSSILSGSFEDGLTDYVDLIAVGEVDPSHSLLLPTLDFSSSFLASTPSFTPPRRAASSSLQTFVDSDSGFDLCSSHSESSWIGPPLLNGWNGFSSQFVGRVDSSPNAPHQHPF